MNFIQQFKRDKKFRFRTILIAMIILIVYGATGENKKEATYDPNSPCNLQSSGCGDGSLIPLTPCTETLCRSTYDGTKACTIEHNNFLEGLFDRCVNCVPNGKYGEGTTACCSGHVESTSQTTDSGNTVWLCKAPPPGTVECNAAENAVASILMGFMPDLPCKTAYYMTIFGGGFLALLIFAAF